MTRHVQATPARRAATSKTKVKLHENSPASLISESVAQTAHVVADGSPFAAAYDANVLHRQYRKEQVLVGPVVPVLAVHGNDGVLIRRASKSECRILQMGPVLGRRRGE